MSKSNSICLNACVWCGCAQVCLMYNFSEVVQLTEQSLFVLNVHIHETTSLVHRTLCAQILLLTVQTCADHHRQCKSPSLSINSHH